MSHLSTIAAKLAKPTKTKAMKQKSPPIKVVYISNPMKVSTSASRFRALVQQLTGRDSELHADPTVYEDDDATDHGRADKLHVLVGGDSNDDVDLLRGSGKSAPEGSSSSTTSSCEVEGEELLGGACYGDEFLMIENLPVSGSDAFLWTTWMS